MTLYQTLISRVDADRHSVPRRRRRPSPPRLHSPIFPLSKVACPYFISLGRSMRESPDVVDTEIAQAHATPATPALRLFHIAIIRHQTTRDAAFDAALF